MAVAYWTLHPTEPTTAKRSQPLQADLFRSVCGMAAEVRWLTNAVRIEGDVIDSERGPMENPKPGCRGIPDAIFWRLPVVSGWMLPAMLAYQLNHHRKNLKMIHWLSFWRARAIRQG